jgi:hypothetical protein
MMDAAQAAMQQAANSATANIDFSSEGAKVTIDVANATTTFPGELGKGHRRDF